MPISSETIILSIYLPIAEFSTLEYCTSFIPFVIIPSLYFPCKYLQSSSAPSKRNAPSPRRFRYCLLNSSALYFKFIFSNRIRNLSIFSSVLVIFPFSSFSHSRSFIVLYSFFISSNLLSLTLVKNPKSSKVVLTA